MKITAWKIPGTAFPYNSVFSDGGNILSSFHFVTNPGLLHYVYKFCDAHQRTFTKTNEELDILKKPNLKQNSIALKRYFSFSKYFA